MWTSSEKKRCFGEDCCRSVSWVVSGKVMCAFGGQTTDSMRALEAHFGAMRSSAHAKLP
jgi:hypothetical protein